MVVTVGFVTSFNGVNVVCIAIVTTFTPTAQAGECVDGLFGSLFLQ